MCYFCTTLARNMSSLIDLRPDNKLLNHDFNGYKLSLDPIPVYSKELVTGVDHVKPSDEQYSFLHMKIFSLHNHLHANPFRQNDVYFIDKKWIIRKLILSPSNHISEFKQVLEIPSNHVRKSGHYNLSLSFATDDLAVISDGAGTIHIVNVHEKGPWSILHSEDFFNDISFNIVDSRCEMVNACCVLNIVVQMVEEKKEEEEKGDSSFQTVLQWIVVTENENKNWSKKICRTLITKGNIDYVALEPGCEALHVIADKEVKFNFDSEKPIVEKLVEEKAQVKKQYSWLQTADDITIWFPCRFSLKEVNIMVTATAIKIEREDEVLLSGTMWQRVDHTLASWIWNKGQIEILLTKDESGQIWQKLFLDDDRGEEILDPQLVEEVHQRLSHLCTESTNPEGDQPIFSSQQLEDCDAQSSETSAFVRLSSTDHSITHEVSLSSLQWLFKVQLEPKQVPAISLRHDVDACVWQFTGANEKDWERKHVGTFLAFGYVQASKTQKKFSVCSPNLSFVAVCDISRHIYVYRQPSVIASELRNRRSGQRVATIAKQQLVSLDTCEEIYGVHATDTFLYVLTENNFYVLHVNVDTSSEINL